MAAPTALWNARWAAGIVAGLAKAGVARVVISPGSRSTPLALAALRHPGITATVLIDERTAAFFALGLAKAEAAPVALVCTSGSAVANWHPAVIEADMAGVPLILLSADRPPELQDCGANQAIHQVNPFGRALRAFHALPPAEEDAAWLGNLMAQCVLESTWPLPGPVQVNVAFREPLLSQESLAPPPESVATVPEIHRPRSCPPFARMEALARRLDGRKGVILCGTQPMSAEAIAALAARLDAPILADPLSNLRFGPHDRSHVFATYDLFLRRGGFAPDYVLRFGAPPVSKPLARWAAESGGEQWVVNAPGRWFDPAREADVVIVGDHDEVAQALAGRVRTPAPPSWMAGFCAAEASAQSAISRHGVPESFIIDRILMAVPEGALLFVGNSMVIRDFDAFSGLSAKAITVMGNRGASGIDGNLSTFLGAASSGRFAASVALVGDLTFLHDVGGLAGAGVDATICVLANDGGVIFDYLPAASLVPPALFERAWRTPQRTDIAAAAKAFNCRHRSVGVDQFKGALAEAMAAPGTNVLEIPIDRRASAQRHRSLWDTMAQPPEASS